MRPWLEAGRGTLSRSIVVAPTRGHTHALKQRCLEERIELLGVEFLTPSLARKKRAALPVLGRPMQLLVLRTRIDELLSGLAADDPRRLVLRSLASDLEAALGDFEDLLRGGFTAADFPRPELQDVFGGLALWASAQGFSLGSVADEAAAPEGAPVIAERLLVIAGGPDAWPDFLGLAALAGRCRSATVVLDEPEWSGAEGGGEAWVEAWEGVLGTGALPIDAPDPVESCERVAALWSGGEGSAERCGVLVGRTCAEEMERVADAVGRLIEAGADSVAVVLPGADAAHARLTRLLEERGVAFADLIGASAPPPIDTRLQRALLVFVAGGCRLEDLLAMWPLLHALGLARLSPGEARWACERLFEEVQSHGIEPHLPALEGSERLDHRELARVARLVLPGWPAHIALADALDRFEAACSRLTLAPVAGWPALREFARRAPGERPLRAVVDTLLAFLPEKGPVAGPAPHAGFARVTLTTARRAAGVAWTDVIFTRSNEGVWPEPRESSAWLPDGARRALLSRGRFRLGLPTGDERSSAERRRLCAIARDARRSVIFSASLLDDENADTPLDPNAWLERVLWARGLLSGGEAGAQALARLAAPAAPAEAGAPAGALRSWQATWLRRRDPSAPFDAHFFGDPSGPRPASLSASLIERGIVDPVNLWFEAVLKVRRVEFGPLRRERGRLVGTAVHRVLAGALRGEAVQDGFFPMPPRADAEARLAAGLAELRGRLPPGNYWESFHMEVRGAAEDLLSRVFELAPAPFAAVELSLPRDARLPLGGDLTLGVHGRMDLVLSDGPAWSGARVQIVDYKTGSSARLSAKSMASKGTALQLGVYLLAASTLGAAAWVWMLRRGEAPVGISADDLSAALKKLDILRLHVESGLYGALTPDRSEYTSGFEWPLACAPVPHATLARKFEATFGGEPADDGEGSLE